MSTDLHGIPEAYALYNRILDTVTVDGLPLGSRVLPGGWNAWECVAQLAFMVDLAQWTKSGVKPDRALTTIRSFTIGAILALWTVCSVGHAFIFRTRILVFSVDKISAKGSIDFRIERIYAFLRAKRFRSIELFHSDIRFDTLRRMIRRCRPALYLEGIDWIYHCVTMFKHKHVPTIGGLDAFSEKESRIIRSFVSKYVRAEGMFAFRTKFLSFVFKRAAFRVVLGIDDARCYQSIAAAAHTEHVPFYAFQHGHITPYNVGWLTDKRLLGARAIPSGLIVWNEYWKQECLALNSVWTSDELIVGGSPKDFQKGTLVRGDRKIVVIPFETEAPREVVSQIVDELHRGGYRILFKLRPDRQVTQQLETLGSSREYVEAVTTITEPVCAVIGTYSTYLYDALASGVPVGIVRTQLRYAERLMASGMVGVLEVGSLEKDIEAIRSLSDAVCAQRASRVAPIDRFTETLGALLKDVA